MPFSNIIAHDSVIHLLKSAFVSERIPSAYLFAGIKGVGKSMIAHNLAKMLNCESHVNCDICENCILIRKRTHPDFIQIAPQGAFIKIEQIHQLQEQLSLKPFLASKRVVLIQNAHQFNQESGNAFLKTLEEPPLNTLLILTTSDEDELLETIRSRCQRVIFPPLSKEHLRTIIQEKNPPDPEKMEFFLNYSYGGIRKELMENLDHYFQLREVTVQILEELTSSKMAYHCKKLEEIVTNKMHLFFMECCKNWFRDMAFIKEDIKNGLHNPEFMQRLQECARQFSLEQLQWSYDITVESEKSMQLFAGKQLALEGYLTRLKQILNGKIVI